MATQPMFQDAFTGGELSDRLRARYGTELYKKGLDFDENWIVLPQGPILMRNGSTDHGALPFDLGVRCVQLRMADEQDFLLVFTDHLLRLYGIPDGQREIVTARDLSSNGDFSDDAGWIIRNTPGSDVDGNCVIASNICTFTTPELWPPPSVGTPVYMYSKQIRQEINPGQAYSGHVYVKIRKLEGGETGPTTPSPGVEVVTLRVMLETGDGSGLVASVDVDRDTYTDGMIVDLPFTMPPGSTTLNLNIYLRTPAGPSNVNILPCTCEIDDVAVVVNREEGFEIEAPWTSDQLAEVQYTTETAKDRTVFFHNEVPFWTLQYNGTFGFWSWGAATITSQPPEWGGDRWPGVGEFHDGRLYVAMGNRVWGSRVGEPFDFTLESVVSGTPTVLPSDGIDYKLGTKGVIRWLQSRKVLLAGTDLGELSIVGSQRAIKPADIHVEPESEFGSAKIQALSVGRRALYVSPDRRKVRTIEFTQDSDGWDTKDLTFAAEHITKELIKELHHAKHPESFIIGLLDTGRFVFCTYDPAEQVAAWWRLRLAGPTANVRSAAVSSGPNGSFLWMAVQRGEASLRLERIQLNEADVPITLDAQVSGTVGVDGSITGLAHLNGVEVRVVLDLSIILPDPFTPAGGSINVGADYAGRAVTVGIGVRPKVVLLPKPVLFGKVRSAKIGVILNRSALPLVNGKRSPDRKPGTPTDSAEGPFTGKFETGNLGSDEEGKIIIEQDLPFRTEVLAVYDATAANDLGK